MSTKIHPKCPREFTQKMSSKIHPKRGLLVDKSVHEMSPKVSMRCHPFCPREVTYYVHEMSATLKENTRYRMQFTVSLKDFAPQISTYFAQIGWHLRRLIYFRYGELVLFFQQVVCKTTVRRRRSQSKFADHSAQQTNIQENIR